jgi:uncharacterized protein (TIGR02757 family)
MEDNLTAFLNRKVEAYNRPSFLLGDPVAIPHLFTAKADQEIAGLFAAVFSWGQRATIVKKATELMNRMDNAPHAFCLHHSNKELQQLLNFKHRTFNATDLLYFIAFLKQHYERNDSLESAFLIGHKPSNADTTGAITGFYHYFFSLPDAPERTKKHLSSPEKKSACKRINMYLRWMVRQDKAGVDLGLWKHIHSRQLIIPLDLHVARVARRFGLLQRQQNDWMAALELTAALSRFDPNDPVKYDFALFALGILEKF